MPLLDVRGVSVSFGGVHALSAVDLDVETGVVTGLIGPNGAGKTTLFNVICGLQSADAGVVLLDGSEIQGVKTHRRARLGIARTFQRLEVFGSLAARDNILVAAEIHKGWDRSAPSPQEVTEEILDKVGVRAVADERVDSMPTGLARLVELGRALATRPKLLLLDEPGSGLDTNETEALGDLLVDLVKEGMAVLLVEHDVELVMRVCEHIYVLELGNRSASGTQAEIQANEAVQAGYLGAETDEIHVFEEEAVT